MHAPRHRPPADDPLKTIFTLLWTCVLLFILYHVLKSCFTRPRGATPTQRTPRPSRGGGWFPGHNPDTPDPPPPYSRHGKQPESAGGWTPGFWTGLGLGGLAASLWGGRRRDPGQPIPSQRSLWDWERATQWWGAPTVRSTPPATPSDGWYRTTPGRAWADDDRGEGPSNLGRMRRSTGWGGSSVR